MKKFLTLWSRTPFLYKMTVGIVIGTICGIFFKEIIIFEILATMFIGALKAIAPFLVFFLVCSSISKTSATVGPKMGKIVVMYLVTTLLAAACAVVTSLLFPTTITLGKVAGGKAPETVEDIMVDLFSNIVDNPITALGEANYLSILFWAIVIGLCIKAIPDSRCSIGDSMEKISSVFAKLISWIISFAPIGIMGLVYQTVSENGTKIFAEYGILLALLVGTILFSALVINPLIVGFMIRRNPYPLIFTCIRESGITAFFTRSSAANIPMNMVLCEKLGLDKELYSISISLGSTINMNGAAITITTITLCMCHTLGIEVSLLSMFILSMVASLAACGVSGVAGGSILLIPLACSLFGIRPDIAMQGVYIGFIIGVIADSFETAHNSSSDAIITAAVIYRDRMLNKEDVGYMGDFAKK